jgi:hypothetical protein
MKMLENYKMKIENIGRKWIKAYNISENMGGNWKCEIEINKYAERLRGHHLLN